MTEHIDFYINPDNHKNLMKDHFEVERNILMKAGIDTYVHKHSRHLLPKMQINGYKVAGLNDMKEYLHEHMAWLIRGKKD